MFMVSLWGTALTLDGEAFLQNYQPGGVTLFGYNVDSPEQLTQLTNAIQETLTEAGASPAWIAIDQEGGVVSRLSAQNGFTTFPANMAVAATADPANARAIGLAMAEELRAVGINMNLAPVADVETNPDSPVTFRRTYSSDPELTADMVAAMVQGLQSGGVMATTKHFPGHGATTQDSHVELPTVDLDLAQLMQVEIPPFRAAIEAGAGTIMAAHIWYPALEPEEMPASLSPRVLGLLRDELGFSGLIMTDALDMDAIDQRYSLAQAALRAIEAGADLITPGPHVGLDTQRAAIDAVVEAVEDGRIPISRIDASVTRILEAKARFGLLTWARLEPATAAERLNRTAHEQLVARILAEAVTLAFDRTNRLPLPANHRTALIYPATTPSIADRCEAYHPDLWLVGVSLGPTPEEIGWAVSAAEWAETVIVFSADAARNADLQALLHALPAERTVLVAQRSPYDLLLFPEVTAYLLTYSPQTEGAEAACAGIFGAAPITGRLPVTLAPDLPAGTGIMLPAGN
ncbi:MAG: glycoside hydrolase family 3 protein [Anaerolineae bacterium]